MRISENIQKYGVIAKLVEENDAQTILRIRTNQRRNQYVSSVSGLLEDQVNWIRHYKEREILGEEFYFLIGDPNVWYGTTRIYNFQEDEFETGSWIFNDEAPEGMAIKGDLIGREFAFEQLGFSRCKFEVRKENFKVIQYHQSYNPKILGEDDLNLYFELSKEDFYKQRDRLIKLLGYGNL